MPPNRFCGLIDPTAEPGEASQGCEPKVLVRAIIEEGEECDKVAERGNQPLRMKFRDKPQEGFPVRVCEAQLELDDEEVKFSDGGQLSWKGLKDKNPQKIVVVGDTGCNPENQQRCESITSWPFRKVAMDALRALGHKDSTGSADLIIHVGDYRYRQGTSDDNWSNWREDFFLPAAPFFKRLHGLWFGAIMRAATGRKALDGFTSYSRSIRTYCRVPRKEVTFRTTFHLTHWI